MNRWPPTIATIAILVGGYATLAWGTNDWTVWTAESARRLAVRVNPIPLPDGRLHDSVGRSISLAEFDRPILLIDFIYTRCPTVCIAMGSEFRQWQSDFRANGLEKDVQLLSITFDSKNDGPEELAGYLSRFSANVEQWTAARFDDEQVLDELLDDLGVVVIAEPTLGFVHNPAVYLVHDGAVVGIYDFDDRVALLKAVQWRLSES